MYYHNSISVNPKCGPVLLHPLRLVPWAVLDDKSCHSTLST